MGFWGIEVKPGVTHPYHSDNVQGKLHITQATLGLGSEKEKSILQCSVDDKNPIFLCTLLPNKNECCPLDLEFDEDDLVAFSVIGPRSIHLSGYFIAECGDHLRPEYDSDSYGEDIAESESDDSSEFDTEDEYDDDFIDDDDSLFPPPPVANSGVKIEEIVDDEKPTNGNGKSKQLKKKDKSSDSERQIIVKNDSGVPVLESEDEDGFPISTSHKGKGKFQEPQVQADEKTDERTSEGTEKEKAKDSSDHGTTKKRKVKSADPDDQPERQKNKKKKKKEKGEDGVVKKADTSKEETNDLSDGEKEHELKSNNQNKKDLDSDMDGVPSENNTENKKKKKQKKKKKKAQASEGDKGDKKTVSATEEKNESTLADIQTAAKSTQARTFGNGMVIEELAMGKPDGKRASPGKQVSVHYIGKLKKNGKIFDSNVGKAPFKFRLGIGQVIKGWDVGINGMRVGDKRRLTLPPAMGYGAKGAGREIPPNAWLVFDVELDAVRN